MEEKYVMDFSLFRVAKQMRLLGCDVACDRTIRHAQVLAIAKRDDRIIVTASRKFVPHLEACQRTDQRDHRGDTRYFVGEYDPDELIQMSTKRIHSAAGSAIAEKSKEQCLDSNAEGCGNMNARKESSAVPTSQTPAARKQRERILKGYNSEGESEYETESSDSDSGRSNLLSVGTQSGDEDDWDENGDPQGSEQEAVIQEVNPVDPNDPPIRFLIVNPFDPFRLQVENIVGRMKIAWNPLRVFTRCVQCNGVILATEKAGVMDEVHETVYRLYNNFYRCTSCERVYWGMDEGVLVNYKALRTVEHAKALCLRASAARPNEANAAPIEKKRTHPENCGSKHQDSALRPARVPKCHQAWGNVPLAGVQPMKGIRIHLYAYPRNIKCTILTYLSKDDHAVLLQGYPVFAELVGVIQRGDSWSFKPGKKKFGKRRVPQGSLQSHSK